MDNPGFTFDVNPDSPLPGGGGVISSRTLFLPGSLPTSTSTHSTALNFQLVRVFNAYVGTTGTPFLDVHFSGWEYA